MAVFAPRQLAQNAVWNTREGIRWLPKSAKELKNYLSLKRVAGKNVAEIGQQGAKRARTLDYGGTDRQNKFMQKVVPSLVEAPTRVPGGIVSGVTHGLYDPLDDTQAETVGGKVGQTAGSLYGFMQGPGKLYYKPIEAPVEAAVGHVFANTAVPAIAAKVAAAGAAEAVSSLPVAAVQSFKDGRPLFTRDEKAPLNIPFTNYKIGELPVGGTYPENISQGLMARGIWAGGGKAVEGASKYMQRGDPGFMKYKPGDDVTVPSKLRGIKSPEEMYENWSPKNIDEVGFRWDYDENGLVYDLSPRNKAIQVYDEVKSLDPKAKVYMHGSWTEGTAHADSDVDFYVYSKKIDPDALSKDGYDVFVKSIPASKHPKVNNPIEIKPYSTQAGFVKLPGDDPQSTVGGAQPTKGDSQAKKVQEEVWYHGTSEKNARAIIEKGWDPSKADKTPESPYAMFASTSKSSNSDHGAGTYSRGAMLEIRPKPEANIKDDNFWYETFGKSKNVKQSTEIANKLRSQGIDAVKDPSGEVYILNPDKFNIKSLPQPTKGDIQTLKKMVNKYDSPEEFANHFLVHGASKEAADNIMKNGWKIDPNSDGGGWMYMHKGGSAYGDTKLLLNVNDYKFMDESDPRIAPLFEEGAGNQALQDAVRKAGYDGITTDLISGREYALLPEKVDTKKIIKSSYNPYDYYKKNASQSPKSGAGQIVYRAEDSTSGKGTLGKGTYVATTKEAAKQYGKDIKEYRIKPGTNMLNLTNPRELADFQNEAIMKYPDEFMRLDKAHGNDEAVAQITTKYAKKQGYDGIMGEESTLGTVVFDKKNLIKNDNKAAAGILGFGAASTFTLGGDKESPAPDKKDKFSLSDPGKLRSHAQAIVKQLGLDNRQNEQEFKGAYIQKFQTSENNTQEMQELAEEAEFLWKQKSLISQIPNYARAALDSSLSTLKSATGAIVGGEGKDAGQVLGSKDITPTPAAVMAMMAEAIPTPQVQAQEVTIPIRRDPNIQLSKPEYETELNTNIFEVTDKYDIPRAVAAGMWAGESRGESDWAKPPYNNPYNINAKDGQESGAFKYPSTKEGAEAFAKFIKGEFEHYASPEHKQRFKDNWDRNKDNPEALIVGIMNAGYAGDPATWRQRKKEQDGVETPYKNYADFISDLREWKKYR